MNEKPHIDKKSYAYQKRKILHQYQDDMMGVTPWFVGSPREDEYLRRRKEARDKMRDQIRLLEQKYGIHSDSKKGVFRKVKKVQNGQLVSGEELKVAFGENRIKDFYRGNLSGPPGSNLPLDIYMDDDEILGKYVKGSRKAAFLDDCSSLLTEIGRILQYEEVIVTIDPERVSEAGFARGKYFRHADSPVGIELVILDCRLSYGHIGRISPQSIGIFWRRLSKISRKPDGEWDYKYGDPRTEIHFDLITKEIAQYVFSVVNT